MRHGGRWVILFGRRIQRRWATALVGVVIIIVLLRKLKRARVCPYAFFASTWKTDEVEVHRLCFPLPA